MYFTVLLLLAFLHVGMPFDAAHRLASIKKMGKDRALILSPSIAKANFLHLGQDLDEIKDFVPWFHCSVQDGVFVPKIGVGSPIISAVRKKFPEIILDVKLGCVNPENRIDEFVNVGADIISIHPESTQQFPAVINKIVSKKISAGVVLNPGTSVSVLEHVLGDVDVVVVMLVNPGWGGKKYISQAISKIEQIHELAANLNVRVPHISVDGGVSTSNSQIFLDAGANVLVAGGSIFSAADKAEAVASLLEPSPEIAGFE